MLDDLLNEVVIADLRGRFVAVGTLTSVDRDWLELRNADLHDLADSDTTRENYVAASAATGVKRNRRRVLLARVEVVALGLLADVVDE